MPGTDEWAPEPPQGTEVFEQGDEALEEDTRLDAGMVDQVQEDPSLDPTCQVDEREAEEAGVALDDPEDLAVLVGGVDDPDGTGEPSSRTRARQEDDGGWDLDAGNAAGDRPEPGPAGA